MATSAQGVPKLAYKALKEIGTIYVDGPLVNRRHFNGCLQEA